jgi:GGDEF domain-containing protein
LIEAVANRRLIAQLARRASTDSLAGLLNRVKFRAELVHSVVTAFRETAMPHTRWFSS